MAIHPDDAGAAGDAFLDANARQAPYQAVFRLRRHDGTYRWVQDTGLPRFADDGAYEGMVGTVIDVHERRLAELALQRLTKQLRASRDRARGLNAELLRANEQLTRTNVDLDTFIYTASHDLREPINNLDGLVQALREQVVQAPLPDPLVPRLLGMMHEAVARFQLTIAQLTNLAQLQQSQSPAAETVDVRALVEAVRLDLAPALHAAGARLRVDVPPGTVVSFPPKHLRSIVYNLLSNAVKYRAPDRAPDVRLRWRREAGGFVLEVEDNGLGLDAGQQARLFGLFERLHHHVEGSGVGLYMVRRIVENAGGTIGVRSQPGAGAAFTVRVPG
ncbi:MAG TPA: PAS domain-containing sensor histidine kinase [Hymenobacter sp.]|jgi:signal transduction histidine kinase|uniref:sensor histidine kinase n=1 Tax=Hymenobacter sp. TaxID=1898978 RepID=UPI002ED9C3A9